MAGLGICGAEPGGQKVYYLPAEGGDRAVELWYDDSIGELSYAFTSCSNL